MKNSKQLYQKMQELKSTINFLKLNNLSNKLIGTTFLKMLILKMFPFLGYKGVVNTQIKIYKKLKRKGYSEAVALNKILDSRRIFSLRDLGANAFYQELINTDNKTLKQVIQAIVEWEQLDSFNARAKRERNNIPFGFTEEYRKEIKTYISKKIETI